MSSKNTMVIVLLLVVAVGGAVWYGNAQYDKGFAAAKADIEAAQKELASSAADEAAKAANPFDVSNPLEGVTANPFEEAQKTLNPFD